MFLKRRDKEDNLYSRLQQRSLDALQRLSGEVWTDFNPHDPGVTMLEILNLALTELDYKLNIPLEDHFATNDGHKEFDRFGLMSAEKVFPDSIVTPADYEQLVTENIPQVTGCSVVLGDDLLYEFTISTDTNSNTEVIGSRVKALYHANRNLCENIGNIRFAHVMNKPAETNSRPVTDTEKKPSIPKYHAHSTYRSVQLDFPDCYGINKKGVPTRLSADKAARIRQLKAYLLIFDSLLADSLYQAENIPKMLELSSDIPSPWHRTVDIEDFQAIHDSERPHHLDHESREFAWQCKAAYFDLLDTIYGESTNRIFKGDITEQNRKRATLIKLFPDLNAGRFRSFDITDRTLRSTATVKKTIAALEGIEVERETPLTHFFTRYHLRLIPDNIFFRGYKMMLNIEFELGDTGYDWNDTDIEQIPITDATNYGEHEFRALGSQLYLFQHNMIFESLLTFGNMPECYRGAKLKNGSGMLLLFEHPELKKWLNMGFFPSKEELVRTANILWKFIGILQRESRTFYLLEHILLSHGSESMANVTSGRLSVILPAWSESHDRRPLHEAAIVQRLPAHLTVGFLWLDSDRIYHFEKLYFPWRKAMALGDREQMEKLSDEISTFFELYGTLA